MAALWSVFLVLSVFVIVADETILTDVVLEKSKGLDGSEWSKDFLNLGIRHFTWNILEVDVVDQFSH